MVLASNVILARLLSPQEFGAYFLAFNVVAVGSLVGSGGLGFVAVRFVAESMGLEQFERARVVVSKVLILGFLGAFSISILYLLFGDALAANLFNAPTLVAVTGLVAGWMLVMILQGIVAETFRGFHDIRQAMIFGGLVTSALLAGSLAVLWFVEGEVSLSTVLLLTVGAGLVNILLAGGFLRRKVMSLPLTGADMGPIKVKEMLKVSWPLLVASLTFYILNRSGIWVLGAFRSTEEVAIYGAVIRLVLLLSMPLTMVSLVLTPLIAEMYARGEKRQLEHVIRTIAILVSIPALLVFIIFVLAGGPILGLVFGEHYRMGKSVLIVLSLGQLATFWSGACGHLLNLTGHQRAAMIITAFSAVVGIVAALALVEDLGMLGVAFASFAALTLQNIAMVLYSRRVIGIRPNVGLPLYWRREEKLR